MNDGTIAEFWSWWRRASPAIAASIDARRPLEQAVIEDIATHVQAVDAGLAWELGPGRSARHAFTVSSEGNIVLRRLTERLARAAPPADEVWEYFPARQPVPDAVLEIVGQRLDGGEWRFGMGVDEDRLLVNLEAFHPKLRKLAKDARPQAGFIAVDQMFGEDAVETWIGELSFTDRDRNTKSNAADVLKAIEGLAALSKEEVFSLARGVDPAGRPLILTFNQRLKRLHHLFADTLVEVDFQIHAPDANGFPASEELHDLTEMEDQLVSIAKDDVHIGHLTGRDHRITYFYTGDAPALRDRVDATLRGYDASYELRSKHDREWAFYREGLYEQFAQR
jgi:hypothetical protein